MIPVPAIGITLVLVFASLARGAHDLWSATAVYLAAMVLAVVWIFRRTSKPLFFIVPLLILLAVGAFSVQRAANPSEARFEWFDLACASLLFVIGLSAFQTDKAARFLVAGMVPVLIINTIVNIYHYAESGRLLFSPSPGTLINPNIAAGFTLFWIPPLLANIREEGPGSSLSPFWASGLFAGFLNLIFARSVWAWICLAVMLPILLGAKNRRDFLKRQPAVAIAVGAVIIGGLMWMLAVKWAELFGPDARGTSRILWWRAAWEMFRSHPWFGLGLGNFPSAYLAFKVGAGKNTLYAHSSLLTVLSETGLAGMAAVLFAAGSYVWRIRSRWGALQNRAPYLHGVFLFLAFSLINLSIEYLVNLSALFVLMSIVAAPAVLTFWRPRPAWILCVCGALFLSLPFVLSPFIASQNEVHGHRALRDGRVPEAMESFHAAVALDPWSWGGHQGLAMTYFQNKEIEQAIHHQKKAIGLNKLNALLHWEMANYLFDQGKKGEAYSYFKKAADFHPGNVLYENSLKAFREGLFERER